MTEKSLWVIDMQEEYLDDRDNPVISQLIDNVERLIFQYINNWGKVIFVEMENGGSRVLNAKSHFQVSKKLAGLMDNNARNRVSSMMPYVWNTIDVVWVNTSVCVKECFKDLKSLWYSPFILLWHTLNISYDFFKDTQNYRDSCNYLPWIKSDFWLWECDRGIFIGEDETREYISDYI